MSSMKVLESLQGEQCTVQCKGREELQVSGELIEIADIGAIMKYSSHSREFIEFIPMLNIDTISHKVLGQ